MNTKTLFAVGLGLSLASGLWAQGNLSRHTVVNQAILDGSPSGLANTIFVGPDVPVITGVRVQLNIAGDFNGDLYSYLRHSSGLAVLLNRVGRTGTDPLGYGDPGLDILLADDAANGDVHGYRTQLGSTGLTTSLTGTWAPDGRNIDPGLVLDTDARTATLSVFNGLDAAGDWTLFVADMSSGGAHTLVSWDLEVTGVPEPGTLALIGLGLAMLCWRRRP